MNEPRFSLPLSWSWGRIDRRHSIPLASGPAFVHSAVVAEAESERSLIDALAQQYSGGFVFKACALDFLERAGIRPSSRLLLAYSAKVSLAGFRVPKKVRQLAAKADGLSIAEVSSEAALPLLGALAKELFPGGEPIRYFYRLEPEADDRCFTASADGFTAAILTLSRYAPDAWHVDLLLRHPTAPPGTMELLLLHVIAALAAEGIAALNLGEVPLISPAQATPVAPRSRRKNRAAQWGEQIAAVVAPLYNVAGLYQFKNKFEPVWEPRYYVGIPRLRLRDLKAFGHASGALAILEEAFRRASQ
ncbi:MAG: DUF2156 domain-containing protein [Gemmataceae bacterium]|nr:DUF2156 domain-containing protein [Gemmataceae bacterium]